MGNAAFYFYPEPDGNRLVTIDLGEGLGEMYSDFEWNQSSTTTLNGQMRRLNGMTREIITISRDRMKGGEELGHKLMALQNHLDRGHAVIFTADTSKTWFGPVRQPPAGGDTTIQVYSNPFRSIVGTQIPSANDYVTIETMGPGMIQEIKKLSSVSSLSSTVSSEFSCDAMNFSYGQRLAFARWYRCHCGLKRLPEDTGKAIVTNEHGILWSLELRLVPDAYSYFRFHPDEGSDQFVEFLPSGDTDPQENTLDNGRALFNPPLDFEDWQKPGFGE
jgi:hypothetical protein